MNTLSTTFECEGCVFKVEGRELFVQVFGTTYLRKYMHHSWAKMDKDKAKGSLRSSLIKLGVL